MAAVAHLNVRGVIDPPRVAVAGVSAGATEALCAIRYWILFAAAIFATPGYDDAI
jgi:dipeptidyl aminopeptidase/acylaminoacyl peptidase